VQRMEIITEKTKITAIDKGKCTNVHKSRKQKIRTLSRIIWARYLIKMDHVKKYMIQNW